jgi:hypothetical protein
MKQLLEHKIISSGWGLFLERTLQPLAKPGLAGRKLAGLGAVGLTVRNHGLSLPDRRPDANRPLR